MSPPAPRSSSTATTALVAFSDLRTAAYCPRKCYYRRRDRSGRRSGRGDAAGDGARGDETGSDGTDGNTEPEPDSDPTPGIERVRSLAFRYDDLLEADDGALANEPIADELDPATYRRNLEAARTRLEESDRWDAIRDPADRDVLATGRDCRGIVHKVLAEPLTPSLVSAGSPPDRGVWEPQTVHAVAAAKALAWEHQRPVDVAYLEYPRHGVIRRLELTTRRKALYRRALRTVRELDGPPARVRNRSKCESCEYARECGVRTRTLRSLLRLE